MRERCNNPNNHKYKNYGGRGIKVCDRWINSFENFLDDMGDRPEGMSIDRIDVNGNYEPSNCRWATTEEQMNNTTSNIKVQYNGKIQTMSVWSRETGINYGTLLSRYHVGDRGDRLFREVRSYVNS